MVVVLVELESTVTLLPVRKPLAEKKFFVRWMLRFAQMEVTLAGLELTVNLQLALASKTISTRVMNTVITVNKLLISNFHPGGN
jgi:hypothetical protein